MPTIKSIALTTAVLAISIITVSAYAQTPTAPEKPTETKPLTRSQQMDYDQAHSQVHTLYLSNAATQNDANEILVSVRNVLPPEIKIFLDASQNAIVIFATPEQTATIQQLIHDLDRPKKSYRLTYTLTDVDSGKRVGTQHFSMVVVPGQQSVLKEGSKVPVATGSYNEAGGAASASGSQTQFTYLDVGINLQATVADLDHGASLNYKVEQSSLGGTQTIAGVTEPIIRQTVLSGTSALTLNKPTILGSTDIPDTTRHTDIEVVLEPIQ